VRQLPGLKPCHYPRNPSGLEAVAAYVWFVPCLCLRFRPEGPFSGSPGRSPGSGAPQTSGFLGLKGRFQSECGGVVRHGVPGAYAPGSAETGPSGLGGVLGVSEPGAYAPGFSEIGPSGLGAGVRWGACLLCAVRVLRFRPEELFSGISGAQPSRCPLLLR